MATKTPKERRDRRRLEAKHTSYAEAYHHEGVRDRPLNARMRRYLARRYPDVYPEPWRRPGSYNEEYDDPLARGGSWSKKKLEMGMETGLDRLPSVRTERSSVGEGTETETDEDEEEKEVEATAAGDGSPTVPPMSSSTIQAIRARKLRILQSFRAPKGPAGLESDEELEIFEEARDKEALKTAEKGGNGLVLSEMPLRENEGSGADALDGLVDAGDLIEWTDEERIEPCEECKFPEKVLMCTCSPSSF